MLWSSSRFLKTAAGWKGALSYCLVKKHILLWGYQKVITGMCMGAGGPTLALIEKLILYLLFVFGYAAYYRYIFNSLFLEKTVR